MSLSNALFGQKTLTDLVRGIRSNKKNESQYISQALQEIKEELKLNDFNKKSIAIQKLTYLQMLGYDMSWAAFNCIEVMSQQKFTSKRIGYTAASQCFDEKTEVITLATQLIRRDITSSSVWEASVALNCLGNICTTDLARDLAADVVSLLNSSRPYIRKKACLVLYKIFLKFPDALRPAFPRLKEKLEDPDPAVVAASVNVICELARKNPKNYIALAPTLFNILTTSSNNWVLIKIIKLFGTLLPIEPRLAKKLVQPLTNLINNTPAVSLLYECIQTCTVGLSDHLPTIKLCITKLRNFVEDPDQNLKYLGLVSLGNIMKIHPKAVAEHRDLVVNCLDDEDITIRLRALDLLEGMATKKNVADIVRKLLDQIEKADLQSYKDSIIEKIITICSKESYKHVADFEWYISVLLELAHITGTQQGELISSQLMDVAIRVQVIRPFAVKHMSSALRDITSLAENPTKGGNCEVLYAAAWIVGEFAAFIDDSQAVTEALVQPIVASLPHHIQSVYMQTALKVFAHAVSGDSGQNLIQAEEEDKPVVVQNAQVDEIVKTMQNRLPLFAQSQYLEVQERACFATQVINLYNDLKASGVNLAADIASLFDEPLNPVAKGSYKKVPIPDDLDLDSWINEPEPEQTEESSFPSSWDMPSKFDDDSDDDKKPEEEMSKEAKKSGSSSQVVRAGPYYLGKSPSSSSPINNSTENIPMATLTKEDLGLKDEKLYSYKDNLKKYKAKKNTPQVSVLKDDDLPPGASLSDTEEDDPNEPNPFANINFNEPLRPEEQLPVRTHRTVGPSPTSKDKPKTKKSKKKEEGKEGKEGKKTKKKVAKEKPADTGVLIDFDPISSPMSSSPSLRLSGFEEVADSNEPAPEKPKKKTTKAKEGKTKKTTKTKEGKVTKKKEAEQPAPAPAKPSGKFKPLCQDENLSIIYELRVNPKQSKKIMTAFAFKNLSRESISNLEFNIPPTLNIRIADQSSPKPPFVLSAGETNSHNVIFDVQAFQQPQRISGSISYQVGSTQAKKDFQLQFPVSAFIIPVKLSKEEFIGVLKDGGPFMMSSTQVQVKPEEDFRAFIVSLATLLHVELIVAEGSALYYGRTIQNHHVAISCKPAGNLVTVDLKCTDGQIVNSLVSEINAFYPRA